MATNYRKINSMEALELELYKTRNEISQTLSRMGNKGSNALMKQRQTLMGAELPVVRYAGWALAAYRVYAQVKSAWDSMRGKGKRKKR